ncbi:MAG TPA: hypothetical protein VG537_03445 [Candidatus Kapabacteria bacterium]|jgi:hypothetical protein|nr:hypothetical protein [Candidatus Kapabacteria bacterium]
MQELKYKNIDQARTAYEVCISQVREAEFRLENPIKEEWLSLQHEEKALNLKSHDAMLSTAELSEINHRRIEGIPKRRSELTDKVVQDARSKPEHAQLFNELSNIEEEIDELILRGGAASPDDNQDSVFFV